MSHLDQMADYLFELFEKEGPIDGILGFSQGAICYHRFYRYITALNPEPYRKKTGLPKFYISIGSIVSRNFELKHGNKSFPIPQEPFLDFPSCHLKGTEDPLFKLMTTEELFHKHSNPVVINYHEGHKVPRSLEDPEFSKFRQFLKTQWLQKYPSEAEHFESNVPYRFDPLPRL